MRLLLGLLLATGVYLLAAFVLSRISIAAAPGTKKEVDIYIFTNGVHTDLVLPAKNGQLNWMDFVSPANTVANDTTAQFIAFGWGDKGFYLETPTWADLKWSTAFKAAFWLSTAAMHVTYYQQMQEGSDCRKISISRAQYARLVHFIKSSFKTNAAQRPVFIKTNANYGLSDAFYEAEGRYSLLYTCNTWANNGLKSCGQKACVWTIFDTGIFYQYR